MGSESAPPRASAHAAHEGGAGAPAGMQTLARRPRSD